MSSTLKGNHYHFTDNGLIHKDYPDLIPYGDISEVSMQGGTMAIHFTKRKNGAAGGSKKVKIFLNSKSDVPTVKALLLEKISNAKVHNRPQTAAEASSAWFSVGLSLLGIIAIVIVVNTVGRARVPVVLLPLIYIGSYIGMNGMLIVAGAVALICVIGAAISISKKREVCVIKQGG